MTGERPSITFLEALELPEDELERASLAEIEDALGPLPRRQVPAGTVLLREGEEGGGIHLVFDGRIELTRETPHGRLLLHAASTGRIVGLHTLAGSPTAFLTCTATTPATVVQLSVAQLSEAFHQHPTLLAHFTALLLRVSAGRHRRSVELQLEVDRLNRSLASDRDRLAQALERLEATQSQLVDSARMATLGELAAGLAHELNNPVVAIERAAAFVVDDVREMASELPDADWAVTTLDSALTSAPVATAEHRRRRRILADVLGDRELADRLLAAGVSDAAAAASLLELAAAGDRDHLLGRLERHHRLGTALRNLASSAGRIADLVNSLRSLARPGAGPLVPLDVHDPIEDALRLLGHRLSGVDVVRRYADLRPIEGRPGELTQVWVNVVANAVEAMDGHGRLVIETDAPDAGHVRVRVVDDGTGIAPETMERLFEPHFTTKRGRVAFGLGMGLVITKRIVDGHGGTIELTSEPGSTTVSVVLPAVDATTPRSEEER